MSALTAKVLFVICILSLSFCPAYVLSANDIPNAQSFNNNISVDTASGSATMVIPIFVPKGRHGLQPRVMLAYSSSAGNGPFGYGWFLDLGSIYRSTRKGVPSYNGSDTFMCSLLGKMHELVPVGTNEYRARVEEDKLKFSFVDGYWVVKDPRGTTYYFGSQSTSRIENSAKVFKWRLDKVVDVFNNIYVIDYKSDSSFEIRYVLKAGLNKDTADLTNAGNFAYVINSYASAPTSGDVSVDYRPGFAVKEKNLITSLTVWGNGKRLRRYQLNYSTNLSTGRALLNNVTEFASDNSSSRVLLNIKYSNTSPVSYNNNISKSSGDNLWNCQFGAGYDHGHENYGPVAGFDVDMGPIYTKASGSVSGVSWSINSKGRLNFSSGQDEACQCWTYVYSNQAKTIPLFGTGGGEWGVYLNGSTNWNRSSLSLNAGYNLVVVTAYHQHESFVFDWGFDLASQVDYMNSSMGVLPNLSGDYNGDGRVDLAAFYPETGRVDVSLSSSTGFLPPATWKTNFGINKKLIMGDYNADGATDIAVYDQAAGTIHVAVSGTTGWGSGTRSFLDKGIWANTLPLNTEIISGDFNGDGYTDLLVKMNDRLLKGQLWLNNRAGAFIADPVQSMASGDGTYTLMAADFNSDGLSDVYAFKRATGDWIIFENADGHNISEIYHPLAGFGAERNPVLADFNYDGRTDVGYYDWTVGKIIFKPSLRRGVFTYYFGGVTEFPILSSLKDANAQVQTGDYNGDGLLDIMVYVTGGSTTTEFINSYGIMRDLPVSIDNGRGGRTDIIYQPSTTFPKNNMPFVLPLVSAIKITNLNRNNDVYTTQYSYSGGVWDAVTREFMGFSKISVVDAYGAKVDTYYNSDGANVYFRARPYLVRAYDRKGKLFFQKRLRWMSRDSLAISFNKNKFTGSAFIYLADLDQTIYDSPGVGRRTSQSYVYQWNTTEKFGDLVRIIDYGEVDFSRGTDIGNDKLTTNITYSNNLSTWILGLPLTNSILNQSSLLQRQERNSYDPKNGNLLNREVWNIFNGSDQWISTQYRYDEFGNVVSVIDSLGRESSTVFDPNYRMFAISARNPLKLMVSHEYYGINESSADGKGLFGLLKCTIDANAQKEWHTYDVWGNQASLIMPRDTFAFPTIQYEYYQAPNYYRVLRKKRIISGQADTLDEYSFYDGLGRIIMTKRPSAKDGLFIGSDMVTYDARGAVEFVYTPFYTSQSLGIPDQLDDNRLRKQYIYDDQGRVVRVNYPDGSYESKSYDSQGVTIIDANGHQQRVIYDVQGRVVAREEFTGADGRWVSYGAAPYKLYAQTKYIYDSLGNMIQVIDAKGNSTSMTYDKLSRKVLMNDPDMHTTSYRYNDQGQIMAQIDAKNSSIAVEYDAAGRPISKSPVANALEKVTYSYDDFNNLGAGRLAQVSYPSGKAAFSYNEVGEEISITKEIGRNVYSIKRSFDVLGRLQSLEYPQQKGTAAYGFNKAGQINSVVFSNPGVSQNIITQIEYNEFDKVKTVYYGNGAIAAYTYDAKNQRVMAHSLKDKNSNLLWSVGYDYDAVGNVLKVVDYLSGTQKVFGYDELNRMISSTDASGIILYQYDQIGNLIRKGNIFHTYGERGAGVHAVTSLSDGTNMAYDLNGNMISKSDLTGTQYYSYDTFNRLVAVERMDAGTVVRYPLASYTYDGEGDRTSKVVYSNKGRSSSLTQYVGDIFENRDGASIAYVLLGGMKVASYDGVKFRWLAGDHLGSVTVVLDELSNMRTRSSYSPWGELLSTTVNGSNTELPWLFFTGKRVDDETGLVYFGARYYNPKIGRYISADPTVQHIYDPQDLNRYAYCRNNPVSLLDPTGYGWKKFWNDVFSTIKYIFNPMQFDPFIKGIVTGDWSAARQMSITAATAFVCSGFNPLVAASAIVSEGIMNTPLGSSLAEDVGQQVFDDMLGMRPGTAYVWSAITMRMAASLTFEKVLAAGSGARFVSLKDSRLSNQELYQLRQSGSFIGDEDIFGPSLKTRGAFEGEGAIVKGLFGSNGLLGSFQRTPLDVPLLKQLGAQHASANVLNVSVTSHLNPWVYASWGVCHQAANATLLKAGISSTIINLGASWDMYVTTAVYGNYGGQLGSRILSGINASEEFGE